MTDLATLPLTLQVALAIGYLSARLAAAGTHYAQKTTDTILQTLVFAALASVMMEAVSQANGNRWIGILLAIAASFVAAVAWQWCGRRAVVRVLRWLKITYEDFQPSTLDSIIHDRSPNITLGVETKDGIYYESRIADLPKQAAHYPYVIDHEGSVGLYVTYVKTAESDGVVDPLKALEGPKNKNQAATITYIPAAGIKRIQFLQEVTCSPSLEEAQQAPES